MVLFSCSHSWGFPRRRPEFAGERNVDVQTCAKCGSQRVSPVQFGPAASAAAPQQLMEAQA